MRRGPVEVVALLRRSGFVAVGLYLCALVAAPRGHHLWRELGLQVLALALCAAYVWALVLTRRAHRAWRVPVACWITLFTLGNVVSNAHTGPVPPPWSVLPSLLLYLACYPCALVATGALLRGRRRDVRLGAVVDAVVGVLAICGGFLAFVVPSALAAAERGGVPLGLVLAFPLCDAVVLGLLVAGVAVSGTGRVSGWFALGVALFGPADWWFIVQSGMGQWRTGTLTDGVWVLGIAVVALVAAAAPSGRPPSRTWDAAALVVPFAAALVALGVLAVGTRRELPAAGVALAVTSILGVLTRLAVAYAHERRHAHAHVLARTDDLTGLGNRRALLEALDAALDPPRSAGIALVLADLDGFKGVNDTLGHAAGDDLLLQVARRLGGCMPADGVLTRLGGDEFAVVLPCPTGDPRVVGDGVARTMLAALAVPVRLDGGHVVTVSASFGLACVALDDPDGEPAPTRGELLGRADVAMYAAKRAGCGVSAHRDTAAPAAGGGVGADGGAVVPAAGGGVGADGGAVVPKARRGVSADRDAAGRSRPSPAG